jgi:hypothetical protein
MRPVSLYLRRIYRAIVLKEIDSLKGACKIHFRKSNHILQLTYVKLSKLTSRRKKAVSK